MGSPLLREVLGWIHTSQTPPCFPLQPGWCSVGIPQLSLSWGHSFSRPRLASGLWDRPKKKQSGKVCRDLWWWEGCRVLIPGELSAQLGGKYGNQTKGAELGKEMPLSSNLGGSWSRAKSCLCTGGCVGPAVWPTPSGGMGKGLGYLCWAGREISQRISCGLRGCGTWLLGMGG